MIGVVVGPDEAEAATEFFELFKTPWEFASPSGRYSAVLTTTGQVGGSVTDVVLAYGTHPSSPGSGRADAVDQVGSICWKRQEFPVYCGRAFFGTDDALLQSDGRAVDVMGWDAGVCRWRIGYNLFAEVRHLLTEGQPPRWAMTPTLDIHIDLLRHMLVRCGVGFSEIVPSPAGFRFICCLTHDLDFFGITRHRFDHTMAGFVTRASAGSLVSFVRGRRTLVELLRNWGALASLPLVWLGWRADFWHPVLQYRAADRPYPSTFFVVPFRHRPGVALPGAPPRPDRAVAYEAADVAVDLGEAVAADSELAVHGIDAWCSVEAGRRELAAVEPIAQRRPGVRMHWLYYTADTPEHLEQAGFDYDSTWGYNDAVGYRAGTSQVFKLAGARHLLELPLGIMDSALFFRDRLGVTFEHGRGLMRRLIADACERGGTLVINWHDRSLAPERLWYRPYRWLLDDIRAAADVWFATAAAAVEWFRLRRRIRFEVEPTTRAVSVIPPARPEGMPGFVLRTYGPGQSAVEERELVGAGAAPLA